MTNRQVTVSIIGKKLGKRIRLENLPTQVLEYETIRKVDYSMLPGEEMVVREGRNGFRVSVKRVFKRWK